MVPSERRYPVAPVAADHVNVGLGPGNVPPGAGLMSVVAVSGATEIVVLVVRFRFCDELSARLAVRISEEVAEGTERLLNVDRPDEKPPDVVPLSTAGVPDIDTVPAFAGMPDSVNPTTGAGDNNTCAIAVEGAWEKLRA